MKRRDVLASVGLAMSTSGCMGLLSTKCKPGEDELGGLMDAVDLGEEPGTVSVRGTIAKFVSSGLVIHDGTGMAELSPPYGKKFDRDLFDRGDCIKATGTVSASYSREYGALNIDVSGSNNLENLGSADDSPPAIPDEPDVFFELDYESGGRDEDETLRLEHAGDEPVAAESLELRRIHSDELSTYRWHELAGVAPETEVTEGDAIRFDKPGDGHLVWRYGEHWARPVSSGWGL